MTTLHHVLVVDDNRAIHTDLKKLLQPERDEVLERLQAAALGGVASSTPTRSFELSFATQGVEGIRLVADRFGTDDRFSLAIIDIRMPPGLDGVETAKNIWKIDAEVQVILLSAYSDYSWESIQRSLGHPDQLFILKKPFDGIELVQAAHALSEKWRLQQEVSRRLSDLDLLVWQRTEALTLANRDLRQTMAARDKLETELRLRQKLDSIGQLAAGIAHEINTPTQFVGDNLGFLGQAFSQLANALEEYREHWTRYADSIPAEATARLVQVQKKLKVDYLLKEVPRALEQSRHGMTRVSEIVASMKQLAHPGGGHYALADLNAALEMTLTLTCNEWKGVAKVERSFYADLPKVSCTVSEISQVLLNLVVNAVHAIADRPGGQREPGVIKVETLRLGEQVEIRISDNGSGILAEHRERLFDPFFTTKQVGKGSGQGLAICYAIVTKRHHGRLWFESVPGQGTTFFVRLPIDGKALDTANGHGTASA